MIFLSISFGISIAPIKELGAFHSWSSAVVVAPSYPIIADEVNVTITFFFRSMPPYTTFGNLTRAGNTFSVSVTIYDHDLVCWMLHEDEFTYHLGKLPAGSYQFDVYVEYYYEDYFMGYGLEKNVSFIVTGPSPFADFTYSPPDSVENQTVTFDASTSRPGWNGTHIMPIVSYEWDFGDGNKTTSSDSVVTHRYMENKTYTVMLNVTDSQGLWNVTSKTITIRPLVHNIAITNITIALPHEATTIYPTSRWADISITIRNDGDFIETFNVTTYANDTAIQAETVTNMTPATQTTINFTWNTTNVAYGNYAIRAYATLVSGETDTTDNTRACWIIVTIVGDVNGDFDCDGDDVFSYVAPAYGKKLGQPGYNPNCDFDVDGDVDADDVFMYLAPNYGKSA